MNPILHPTRTVKYVFAALFLPLLAILAFEYVGDSLITMVLTVYMVLPILIVALIFWWIDRKKKTSLRFYTNYLLLCFFALSIIIAAASRIFYEPYRVDCLKREEVLGMYLLDYHEKFGHYPASLDDPFFDNAPKGSIIPYFGRYRYEYYDPTNLPPPDKLEPTVEKKVNRTEGIAYETPAPPPINADLRGVKEEVKQEPTISIRYTSLFGRDRCFGDCEDFEREHDGFLSSDIEEFDVE